MLWLWPHLRGSAACAASLCGTPSCPHFLAGKILAAHPELTARDTDLVLRGLRQFFMAHLRSNRQFVAMPSKVVDTAWHEFILHTRGYQSWCQAAFGSLLHHTPAEVLGRDPKRNDGLRRSWYWACKEESIDPRKPSRLPLLFALDAKFGIVGGFHYRPDCSNINGQSGSDAYCGTSFSEASGDGGAAGDAHGLGGSEIAIVRGWRFKRGRVQRWGLWRRLRWRGRLMRRGSLHAVLARIGTPDQPKWQM